MVNMSISFFEQWKSDNADTLAEIRKSAHELHASVNQTYGGDKPYGVHLDMVAESVYACAFLVCIDEEDLLPLFFGAYYHDSIEDARLTYNDVRKRALAWMGSDQAYAAAEIVYALTNEKGRTRAERAGERYYAGIRNTPFAPFVKLADRLANMTYSWRNDNAANLQMRKVYAAELPHFIEAIDAHSDDVRLSLPRVMIERIESLLVGGDSA